MTASSLTSELKESVVPYTNYRIALATAFLGSLGATVGWLSVVAYEARDSRTIRTALIGAAVGLAVHWLQHYVRVAIGERKGEVIVHHGARRSLFAALWALTFSFGALVSEHLLSHMVSEFLSPFLASLASLIPAGAILGWSMSRGRDKDENFFTSLATGLWTGALIAIATGIIWTIGFGTAPWLSLFGWWAAIAIGIRALTGTERNSVRPGDPIAAVVLVFVASLLLRVVPLSVSQSEKLGPLKPTVLSIVFLAAQIQQSPGLPAKFWAQAEEERTKESGRSETEPAVKKSPVPRQAGIPRPMTADRLKGAADYTTSNSPKKPLLSTPERESWLLILFFAVGVGFAPQLERSLRPPDYPSSETFKRDIFLTKVMGALVVLACVIARLVPSGIARP